MCALEGRGIIYTIPRHGDGASVRLHGRDDTQFVLGADPGVDIAIHDRRFQGLIIVGVNVHPGQNGLCAQAQFVGNGASGDRMIARDHHHADAGFVAFGNGRDGIAAWRIDGANQAQ